MSVLRKVSMLSRRHSARKSPKAASSGRPQLTLAKLILLVETTLRYFARPLFFAGLFVALSWMGIFTVLYPWAHLVALTLFVILFFDAVGRARILWSRPSLSLAMRRVEEASGLLHRPLDVLADRPTGTAAESHSLWQEHVLRARAQTKKLRWPKWKFDFAKHDRYNLRYVLGALLVIGLITGWGALGGRMIAAINPALGKLPLSTTTIDAWITPPEYTHLPPIMIATPAGTRFQGDVIKVPEGSILHAYVAERDGDTPVLAANNQRVDFNAEDGKDFGITVTLNSGDVVAIERGWSTLGSWKVQVVPDHAPQIAFTDVPVGSEHKDLRIAYDAKDDYGVTSVTARLTPHESFPGISSDPFEIPLAKLDDKDVKRVDFKDLTAQPWAGLPVDIQLMATDAVGHKSETDRVMVTLPERVFLQPMAKLLIEERKKLMTNIFDQQIRNEIANLMAGVAKQPTAYGSDPVIMMALRAGAVRLVLDHDLEAGLSAKDILWQTAVRIEDGVMGVAEENLKKAQDDLAEALDRNASEKEIQALIDRLHKALAQYLAQLSTRMASQPPPDLDDLKQVMGPRTNTLTPEDLNKMLNDMRGLSAKGSREEAREVLSQLKQTLENLSTNAPRLNEDQKQALKMLKDLKELTRDQKELQDKTYQSEQKQKKNSSDLSKQQAKLQTKLKEIADKAKSNASLKQGGDAMARVQASLKKSDLQMSISEQEEVLKNLREAQESMAKSLREGPNGIALESAGNSDDADPFGHGYGKSQRGDLTDMHLPDRFETQRVREILDEIQRRAGDLTRPKIERDYIERLLQNF